MVWIVLDSSLDDVLTGDERAAPIPGVHVTVTVKPVKAVSRRVKSLPSSGTGVDAEPKSAGSTSNGRAPAGVLGDVSWREHQAV